MELCNSTDNVPDRSLRQRRVREIDSAPKQSHPLHQTYSSNLHPAYAASNQTDPKKRRQSLPAAATELAPHSFPRLGCCVVCLGIPGLLCPMLLSPALDYACCYFVCRLYDVANWPRWHYLRLVFRRGALDQTADWSSLSVAVALASLFALDTPVLS